MSKLIIEIDWAYNNDEIPTIQQIKEAIGFCRKDSKNPHYYTHASKVEYLQNQLSQVTNVKKQIGDTKYCIKKIRAWFEFFYTKEGIWRQTKYTIPNEIIIFDDIEHARALLRQIHKEVDSYEAHTSIFEPEKYQWKQ